MRICVPTEVGMRTCLFVAGNLVINPFDPNAPMQQWVISERKIQNRHYPNVVLEVRAEPSGTECTRDVTASELPDSSLQLWNVSHVYVNLMTSVTHLTSATCTSIS